MFKDDSPPPAFYLVVAVVGLLSLLGAWLHDLPLWAPLVSIAGIYFIYYESTK